MLLDRKHLKLLQMDGLVPVEINGIVKTRVEHANGKLPLFVDYLRNREKLVL